MNAISCIITDDEPFARSGLASYVNRISYLRLEGVCTNGNELRLLLEKQKVNLLFLDIQMPGLTGIDLIKSLADPPKVIFTTAYEEYALQGYELDVLDYLLKPISFERFLKATDKAAEYFAAAHNRAREYFFIKTSGKLEKIFYEDIVCIEALQNYIAIYTTNTKHITHSTLKNIQVKLPGHFIKTHKSWLVNTAHVNLIENNFLNCGRIKVPMSKILKPGVLRKISEQKVLRKFT